MITRASLMCTDQVIELHDLALPVESGRVESGRVDTAGTSAANAQMKEPSCAEVEAALLQSGDIVADAASALGMTRQSLYRRMERFGIARGAR